MNSLTDVYPQRRNELVSPLANELSRMSAPSEPSERWGEYGEAGRGASEARRGSTAKSGRGERSEPAGIVGVLGIGPGAVAAAVGTAHLMNETWFFSPDDNPYHDLHAPWRD